MWRVCRLVAATQGFRWGTQGTISGSTLATCGAKCIKSCSWRQQTVYSGFILRLAEYPKRQLLLEGTAIPYLWKWAVQKSPMCAFHREVGLAPQISPYQPTELAELPLFFPSAQPFHQGCILLCHPPYPGLRTSVVWLPIGSLAALLGQAASHCHANSLL